MIGGINEYNQDLYDVQKSKNGIQWELVTNDTGFRTWNLKHGTFVFNNKIQVIRDYQKYQEIQNTDDAINQNLISKHLYYDRQDKFLSAVVYNNFIQFLVLIEGQFFIRKSINGINQTNQTIIEINQRYIGFIKLFIVNDNLALIQIEYNIDNDQNITSAKNVVLMLSKDAIHWKKSTQCINSSFEEEKYFFEVSEILNYKGMVQLYLSNDNNIIEIIPTNDTSQFQNQIEKAYKSFYNNENHISDFYIDFKIIIENILNQNTPGNYFLFESEYDLLKNNNNQNQKFDVYNFSDNQINEIKDTSIQYSELSNLKIKEFDLKDEIEGISKQDNSTNFSKDLNPHENDNFVNNHENDNCVNNQKNDNSVNNHENDNKVNNHENDNCVNNHENDNSVNNHENDNCVNNQENDNCVNNHENDNCVNNQENVNYENNHENDYFIEFSNLSEISSYKNSDSPDNNSCQNSKISSNIQSESNSDSDSIPIDYEFYNDNISKVDTTDGQTNSISSLQCKEYNYRKGDIRITLSDSIWVIETDAIALQSFKSREQARLRLIDYTIEIAQKNQNLLENQDKKDVYAVILTDNELLLIGYIDHQGSFQYNHDGKIVNLLEMTKNIIHSKNNHYVLDLFKLIKKYYSFQKMESIIE